MPDISAIRRRLRLVLAGLLAVCVIATAVLLSPIGSFPRTRRREVEQLQNELRMKTAENQPLRGIDHKIVNAQDQVAVFYRERLPSSYASISEALGTVAADNGVTLSGTQYHAAPAELPGLDRVLLDATIKGDYVHALQFINALEREKTFFVIDHVSLTGQQGGIVQLQIQIEAFLKEI